jgi:hypothetical protein
MKPHGAIGAGGEDAVGEQGMGVAVEVEHRAETLHDRDGTSLRVGNAVSPRASTLPGEQLAQEHTESLAQQVSVSSEQKSYPTRQRQYPLSIRHDWEYPIDEVRPGACHSATRTRRAESARLARECDQSLLGARVAAYAHESMAEEAACEELLELALDETEIAEALL